MKKIIFTGLLLSAPLALSETLTLTGFETVKKEKVPQAATLGAITLKKLGTGIRQKKVILMNVNVYRATLFGSEATFSRDIKECIALDSLINMRASALQLQFLRSVSAKDILSSFEAALKENGVQDSPSLSAFKAAVKNGGDLSSGQSVSIAMDKEKGLLSYQQGKLSLEIKGDAKFFRDVFSIWLGKSADSGLAKLREELISGK